MNSLEVGLYKVKTRNCAQHYHTISLSQQSRTNDMRFEGITGPLSASLLDFRGSARLPFSWTEYEGQPC